MSIYFYFYEDLLLYIGSSFNIERRLWHHKSDLKCGSEMPFYKYLREHELILNDLEIEIIKTDITNKKNLEILEGKCIKLYNPKCNVVVPGRTSKEHYEENKERILKTQKEYYEENKETINERNRSYQHKNKEIIKGKKKVFYEDNKDIFKEKSKIYREENKEQIKIYRTEYKAKNREILNAKQKIYQANNKHVRAIYIEANRDKINARAKELRLPKKEKDKQS
jgi:hypothetical protein